MSAHVLLTLLNKLGKKIKNARLSEHFITISNEFNKFNNTCRSMNVRLYLSYDIKITFLP